jgi:hypothetical protein
MYVSIVFSLIDEALPSLDLVNERSAFREKGADRRDAGCGRASRHARRDDRRAG